MSQGTPQEDVETCPMCGGAIDERGDALHQERLREALRGLLEVVEQEGISLKWKSRVKAARAALSENSKEVA